MECLKNSEVQPCKCTEKSAEKEGKCTEKSAQKEGTDGVCEEGEEGGGEEAGQSMLNWHGHRSKKSHL